MGKLKVCINRHKEESIKLLLQKLNRNETRRNSSFFRTDWINCCPDDLKEIAKKAIDRKTGARGLRAIAENILLETMFEIPSKKNVKSALVTKKVLTEGKGLEITYLTEKDFGDD